MLSEDQLLSAESDYIYNPNIKDSSSTEPSFENSQSLPPNNINNLSYSNCLQNNVNFLNQQQPLQQMSYSAQNFFNVGSSVTATSGQINGNSIFAKQPHHQQLSVCQQQQLCSTSSLLNSSFTQGVQQQQQQKGQTLQKQSLQLQQSSATVTPRCQLDVVQQQQQQQQEQQQQYQRQKNAQQQQDAGQGQEQQEDAEEQMEQDSVVISSQQQHQQQQQQQQLLEQQLNNSSCQFGLLHSDSQHRLSIKNSNIIVAGSGVLGSQSTSHSRTSTCTTQQLPQSLSQQQKQGCGGAISSGLLSQSQLLRQMQQQQQGTTTSTTTTMQQQQQQQQQTPRSSFCGSSSNKENEINEGIAKRLTELESELVRERAQVQVLHMEKAALEQQLKRSAQHLQASAQKRLEDQETQLALQEKDVLIQQLMEELNNKSISELNTEAEKAQFRSTLTSFKTSIMELEGKLAMLATENERLNQKLLLRDQEVQRKSDENVQLEDFLRAQYEEKVKDWEQKLNTLMQENDKIVLINQNLSNKLDASNQQLKSYSELKELELREQSEQWRIHCEKRMHEQTERGNAEKGLMESQLQHSLQLNQDLEQKTENLLQELDGLKKELHQRDCLLGEFESRASALERKADAAETLQGECADLQERLAAAEKRLHVLLTENTHLADIASLAQQEVLTWKAKFDTQTKNYQQLTEENRKVLEEQIRIAQMQEKKSWEGQVEKSERDKKALEEKVVQMAVELEKCHDLIHKLSKDSEALKEERRKNHAMEEQNAALEEQATRQSARLKNLEQKLDLLVKDNAQLNTATQRRIEETEVWRNKCQVQERDFELKMQEFRGALESEYRLKTEAASNEFGLQKAGLETELNKQRARAVDMERVQETLLADMSSQGQVLSTRTKELDESQKQLRSVRNELENTHRQLREITAELEDERSMKQRREKSDQERAADCKKRVSEAEARAESEHRAAQEQRQAAAEAMQRLEVHLTETEQWKKVHSGVVEKTERLIQENEEMARKVQLADKYRTEYENLVKEHAKELEEVVKEQEGRAKIERGRLEQRINAMGIQIEQLEESRHSETDTNARKLLEIQEKHTNDLQQMQQLFDKRQSQFQEKTDLEIQQLQTVRANLFKDNETLKKANDKMVREIESLKKKNHDLQQLASAAQQAMNRHKNNSNIAGIGKGSLNQNKRFTEINNNNNDILLQDQALEEELQQQQQQEMQTLGNEGLRTRKHYNNNMMNPQMQIGKRTPSLDVLPRANYVPPYQNHCTSRGQCRGPFMMNQNPIKQQQPQGFAMVPPPQIPGEFFGGNNLAEENDRMNRNILNRCRGLCQDTNNFQQTQQM